MPKYEAQFKRTEHVRFVFPHEDSPMLTSEENLAAAHAEALGRLHMNELGPAKIRNKGEWESCGWVKIEDEVASDPI